MSGILGLDDINVVLGDVDKNLHPTVESVCAGCEWYNKAGCDGKSCQSFLNPAGK